MKTHAMISLLCLLALLLTACNWKGTKAVDYRLQLDLQNNQAKGANTKVWQATPFKLRIFPGTKVISEDGKTWIDIRLELLDDMEDHIKSTGQYRFTYDLLDAEGNTKTPEPILIWDMAVMSYDDQVLHYDRISRTYRFKLELNDVAIDGRPFLNVVYTCPLGTRLKSSLTLDV